MNTEFEHGAGLNIVMKENELALDRWGLKQYIHKVRDTGGNNQGGVNNHERRRHIGAGSKES